MAQNQIDGVEYNATINNIGYGGEALTLVPHLFDSYGVLPLIMFQAKVPWCYYETRA